MVKNDRNHAVMQKNKIVHYKGDDYCEQCNQLKSMHSRWWGGGAVWWSCEDSWYVWQFLNADFWNGWMDRWWSDGGEEANNYLINALFWEWSAYTKWWYNPTNCGDMKVVFVNGREDIEANAIQTNNIWNTYRLNSNTIFVLMAKELEVDGRYAMGECTAIVSPVETQLYNAEIAFDQAPYAILDNLWLSAYTEDGEGRAGAWVRFSSTHSDTVNDVQAYSYEWYWFSLNGGVYTEEFPWVHNILLNNLQAFGNTNWGIVFSCGSDECSMNNITVNNSQFYRNGREDGLGW